MTSDLSSWAGLVVTELQHNPYLRVVTASDLEILAQKHHGSTVSKPTVRTLAELFTQADVLKRISNGLYLNLQCVPVTELGEAAGHIRAGAVVSMQTVLGDKGILNNFTEMVTAVVPLDSSKGHPNIGEVHTSTGERFRFHEVPERLLFHHEPSDLLDTKRQGQFFLPEAAILHWLYLSDTERTKVSPPPLEMDLDELDIDMLKSIAKTWGIAVKLEPWLKASIEYSLNKDDYDDYPPPRRNGGEARSHLQRSATPLATGSAIRVLFIDFDGVLHPTMETSSPSSRNVVSTGFFGWLPVLTNMLRPFDDVRIVVHSTWRHTHDLEELRELLDALGDRVIGVTPRGAKRYDGISQWLVTHPGSESHRILDDETEEFPTPLPPELIVCDPSFGVTDRRVRSLLLEWLKRSLDDG